ncbi:MAG: caspase family protein [Deltaproteobacteria bacterium]|nr:caspase family protein [Deltaproteobacteria bacterium]
MKKTPRMRSLVLLTVVAVTAVGCRRSRQTDANQRATAQADRNTLLDRQAQLAPSAVGTQQRSEADHYEVPVVQGDRLVVTVESTAFDPVLEVVLPDGSSRINDDYQGSRQRSQLTLAATTAGALKVRVRAYRGNTGGAYHVRVARSTVAAVANTNALSPQYAQALNASNAVNGLGAQGAAFLDYLQPSEATTHHRLPAAFAAQTALTSGRDVRGTLAEGDTVLPSGELADAYTFTGQVGEMVVLGMNSTAFDSYLIVQTPSGRVLADDDSGGTLNSQLTLAITEPGEYRVIAASARPAVNGAYELKFQPTRRTMNQEWYGQPGQPAQPGQPGQPGQPAQPAPPVAATVQPGTLATGDQTLRTGEFVDRYQFNWPVGSTVRVRLESSAFDPYVIVRAPSGAQQDNDDASPSDRNSQLDYVVREAGQHTVMVTSYRPGESGAYQLTVGGGAGQPGALPIAPMPSQPTQPTQPSQPSQQPGALGAQTVQGVLAQGDATRPSGEFADSFQYTFPAGAAVRLEATSEALDTFLIVRSPSGQEQQNDDGIPGTTNSALSFVTSEAGAYTVTVSSYRAGETGAYALSVQAPGITGGTQPTAQPSLPTAIPVQPSQPSQPSRPAGQREIRGTLARGDTTLQTGEFVDTHAMQFRPGESVRLRLDSAAFDTYLIVRTPGGRQLDNDDLVSGNTNSGLDIPSAEAGNYQIRVTSYRPNETGEYTLRIDHGAAGSLPADTAQPSQPGQPSQPSQPGQPSIPSVAGGARVWGVFAGITDYPAGVNDLPECANDATKLVETLTERGLLTAERRVLLTDSQATVENVRQAIRRIGPQLGPQDVFVFFYSGHGGRTSGGSRDARELDGMDEYLYLYDGRLMDDEMGTLFDSVRGSTSILALDSCFAGGFAKDVITRPGRIGLFSSEEDVTSSVAQQFRAGGYLSHFLRLGMGGEADRDPRDNALTVGELTHYVWRQFAQNAANVDQGEGAYQHLVVDRGAVPVGQVLWTYGR